MEVIPVHRYLAMAAEAGPDAPALVGAERRSYRQLDADSSAFARALSRSNVEPGDRVALCAPKSAAGVTALYGALKAGCAYVPLDPGQPIQRVRVILDDAGPAVLVTDAAHLVALASAGLPSSLVLVVLVDGDVPSVVGLTPVVPFGSFIDGSGRPVADASGPDDVAVLLYTSGSTGVPKGVQITLRNLHGFVAWAGKELDLRSTDVFASHAGFHFDLSTFDLFAAAAAGAAVWLIGEEEAGAPDALGQGIARHGVTVWYSVPSILALMVAAGSLDGPAAARLRYVLFAGEVFPIKQLRALRERLPRAALYNLYGPTETNVCTYYRVDAVDPARETPVPIGRPLPGMEAWLIDEGGQRCGDGETGELVIRGPCVTPGYWGAAGRASGQDHAAGVHATGDLVSFESGELVYRGRKDRMIKLNGYRIELGEIEAALLGHPAIAEAAVIAAEIDGATRLIAFYAAAEPDPGLSLLQVKSHCRQRLPRYMIPHGLTRLDRLPRNPNGKIDLVRLREVAAPARGPRRGSG